jgi:hypothetical protein
LFFSRNDLFCERKAGFVAPDFTPDSMNTPTPRPIDLRDFWLSAASAVVFLGIALVIFVTYCLPTTCFRRTTREYVDVQITSAGSRYNLRVDAQVARHLGRNFCAEDLIARFEQRRAMIRSRSPLWPAYNERALCHAADVLIQVKHPKTLETFVGLFEDPDGYFSHRATDWLVKLGDPRTRPYLLESWTKHPQCSSFYIGTFTKLPYKPAVPLIIDAIEIPVPMRFYNAAENSLSAIEAITGKLLYQFRIRRIADKDSLDAFKAELRRWWSAYNANEWWAKPNAA